MSFLENLSAGYQGNTSVEQEVKRNKMKAWIDVVLGIVIVIGVLLYRESGANAQNTVTFSQTQITITSTEGDTRTILFDQLESAELFSDFDKFDKGEAVQAKETKKCYSGVYRNEEFGEYYLFVNPKYDNYIVTRQGDEIIIFNYENKESTEDAYHFLQQVMEDTES